MADQYLDFSPERALQSAKNILRSNLWDILQIFNGLDSDQSLYGVNGIPEPLHIGASPHDDLGIDNYIPGVFLTYRLGSTFRDDASYFMRGSPTIEARIVLSEQATGTAVPDEYVNQMFAYQRAVAYILSTIWLDKGRACDAGVVNARLQLIDDTPLIRLTDAPMFVRIGRVVVELDQQIFNQWHAIHPYQPVAITSPAAHTITSDDDILVEGIGEPGTVITVNGVPVQVDGSGAWSILVHLAAGQNTITAADDQSSASVVVVLVTPIVITYPPDGAIMPAGLITFTGTGPAGQNIYAEGDTIPVDSGGVWTWEHVYAPPINTIVFTGEDGQAASVTLNVLSDPLKMDPIGELIDGKYYVFTDSVTVTGTAQPSIPIVVNGQTVQVDAQGDWSATVSVVHGENVIRAVGDDGQIVQRVVTLWNDVDLLAMEPVVFVDTLDESTLWIDEHKTQQASSIGDPVWVVENKGTLGDLADFSSATSADRPVRRADGVTDGRIDCTSLSILPRPYSVFGSAYRYGGDNGDSSIRSQLGSVGKDGDVAFFTGSSENLQFGWLRRDIPVGNIFARSIGAILTGQEIPGDVYLIRVSADEISEGNPDPDGQYALPASPTRNYTAPWAITPNSVMTVAKFILFDRALSKDNAQLICKWMRAMEVTP